MKKLVALSAAALLSANASAGYVQYNFSGPITGYFVQHDDDQSIAYYDFRVPIAGTPAPYTFMNRFAPLFGEGSNSVGSTTTHFRNNGPSNLTGRDNFGADHDIWLSISFARATGGNFSYTANYGGWIYFHPESWSGSGTVSGLISKGVVDPGLARMLDDFGGYAEGTTKSIPRYIGPNPVPEPGSFALLAIGALGVASLRRRKPH